MKADDFFKPIDLNPFLPKPPIPTPATLFVYIPVFRLELSKIKLLSSEVSTAYRSSEITLLIGLYPSPENLYPRPPENLYPCPPDNL